MFVINARIPPKTKVSRPRLHGSFEPGVRFKSQQPSAEIEPAGKVTHVKKLRAEGKHVAMAGDDINDAR
jgi:hypothetical protein